jgi:hypothetical protein
MFCISKTRACGGKLVPFLDSAGQIYPETGLKFEAPKCVLTSVIYRERCAWLFTFTCQSPEHEDSQRAGYCKDRLTDSMEYIPAWGRNILLPNKFFHLMELEGLLWNKVYHGVCKIPQAERLSVQLDQILYFTHHVYWYVIHFNNTSRAQTSPLFEIPVWDCKISSTLHLSRCQYRRLHSADVGWLVKDELDMMWKWWRVHKFSKKQSSHLRILGNKRVIWS